MSTFMKSAAIAALLTGTAAMADGSTRLVAQFQQAPVSRGALPKVAYYKNEDVLKTTTTTTRTPIYTTVQVPIIKKGVTVGYTPTQKLTGYNVTTTKSTAITPKSEIYTTNGNATTPGSSPAKFEFMWPIVAHYTANLNGIQNATLSLRAVSTSAPVISGSVFNQIFDSGTLSLTRTVAVRNVGKNGAYGPLLSNLLTVNFTNAVLSGQIGGTAASLYASTPTSTLHFTSDFMHFTTANTPIEFDFAIAESAATPAITRALVDPTLSNVTGERSLVSFRGNPIGQFGSNGVPEPASWALMIGGFAILGAAARRRRVAVL